MIDAQLKEQLKSVFSALEGQVELNYEKSSHADQTDLVQMLEDVASTSDKITARAADSSSAIPQFHITHNGKATGITFKGIPGGHEFTSLILAILNSDGKGKMLDTALANRVRRLNKNIIVQTFMSLTCENCPDVVQALNQMAIIHGSMKHEVIDGAYAEDLVKSIGIQGVPSVVKDGKMFHSGRISVLELLEKLENAYGIDESAPVVLSNENLGHFKVLVIGGGPAGASAAIYSARKGLSTAVIAERIGGQVQETKGIENLIGTKYTEGPQLAAQLAAHMGEYEIKILENRRVKKIHTAEAVKKIELESGETVTADSVIIATGAKWRELGVEGEKDYLGRGVAYCPHCDGPFYKGKKVAVVGGGNSGIEAAIDLAGIVKEVIVYEFNDTCKADKVLVDKLKSMPNTSIVTNARTSKVVGDGAKVTALEYVDRATDKIHQEQLDGIFVQIGLLPNTQFLKETLELTKFGEIVIDNKCRTSIPGIYGAGDCTTVPYKQIVISMGEGAKAALAAFEDSMLKH